MLIGDCTCETLATLQPVDRKDVDVAVVRELRRGGAGGSERPLKRIWPESADLNLRGMSSLARYVAEKHGAAELAKLAASVGLEPSALQGESRWISLQQFEAFLAAARELLGSDDKFQEAAVYKYGELAFGPLRFVLWATSPRAIYDASFKQVRVISAISRYEPVEWGRSHVKVRYTSTRREQRLFCLLRQAMGRAMPTLWGLPPAHFTEGTCIARGDDACEYTLRWYERRRWLPILVGLGVGAVAGVGAYFAGLGASLAASLPVLGSAIGWIHELRAINAANIVVGEQVQEALTELARDDAAARTELLALQSRQADWTRVMEQQVNERTAALHDVAHRIESLQRERVSSIQGLSHDLKNPLGALKANVGVLARDAASLPAEVGELIGDLALGVERMEHMLADLVDTAVAEALLVSLSPKRMAVPPIAGMLERRLRAFVHGRDIRVSSFATREAPESIVVDEMLFNRVIDNLVTNAAKYTERGSIVAEVTGKPGFLTVKISDTGRGIAPEDLERVFHAAGSDPAGRAAQSHGVGLSVVVQLLDQIGGGLEVMSRLGEGTTFWVHFPVEHDATTASSTHPRAAAARDEGARERIQRVLKVRRLERT